MDRKQREDERDRPGAVRRRASSLGRFDFVCERDGGRLAAETELTHDGVLGVGGGVNRRGGDVPGDAEDSGRPGNRDDPGLGRTAREQKQQRERRVPERGQGGERALGAVGPAEHPDRVAGGVNREPPGHEHPQGLRRDKRPVDQDDRDRHADRAADRRPPARGGVRETHRVQQLEARRKREQRSDAGGWELGPAHRGREREKTEAQRHDGQAGDPDATPAGDRVEQLGHVRYVGEVESARFYTGEASARRDSVGGPTVSRDLRHERQNLPGVPQARRPGEDPKCRR